MKNNKKSVYVSIYRSNLIGYHKYIRDLKECYGNYKYFKGVSIRDKSFEYIVERHKERIDYYKLKVKHTVEILRIYKYKIRNVDRNEN